MIDDGFEDDIPWGLDKTEIEAKIPGGVRWSSDGEGQVRCPFHDDKNPSCSININKEVFHCHACGQKGKLSKLLERCGYPSRDSGNQQREEYDYQDAAGALLYQAVRYYKDGEKKFSCQKPNGSGGWIKNIKGVSIVPYNLPAVQKAIREGENIFIVEGEKDADRLGRMGYVATCNHGGAEKWRKAHADRLVGAKVVISGDYDEPGQRHVEQVRASLQGVAESVKILDLGYPIAEKHGQDISNWLDGHGQDEFKELIEKEQELKKSKTIPIIESEKPVKDYGHASVLSEYFIDRFRWAPYRGKWREWVDTVWEFVEENRVAKIASDTLRAIYATQLISSGDKDDINSLIKLIRETCIYARIMGALSFLKGWDGILTRTEEWDREPWLLNVQNGVVNLKSMKLEEHSPKRLLTKIASCEYQPEAESELWNAHIELFLPNGNIRREAQRNLGLALIGTGIDEILPIWYGAGQNGKSTTALMLRKVLGDYIAEAAPGLLLQTKYERHPTEIAELDGKRLVFSSEIGRGKKLDEELVKRLTGGDVKRGRFMRQDFFDIEQSFTIFLICNHHPSISGVDDAMWRRPRLIPWTYKIPDESRLPQNYVIERLDEETPAILKWIIDGLADWQKEPSWVAPEVRAATDAYRAEQDRLSGFMGECIDVNPHYTELVKTIYNIYVQWCNDMGEESLGKTAFGNRLKEQGFYNKKDGSKENAYAWFGLRLKSAFRTLSDVSPVPPLENEVILGEHENTSDNVRRFEQKRLDNKNILEDP